MSTPRMLHTGRMARWAAANVPVTFVAFDLLYFDGQDLTGRRLVERKRLLNDLALVGPAWASNGWYPEGDTLFEVCIQQGHEGVVAKRLDSVYLPGQPCPNLAEAQVPGVEASACSATGGPPHVRSATHPVKTAGWARRRGLLD
jgi:hypothetical protein